MAMFASYHSASRGAMVITHRWVEAIAITAAACVFSSSATFTLPSRNIWDGVYTEVQATRGEKIYRQKCVPCHASNLKGNEIAPSIVGTQFFAKWDSKSLSELFDIVTVTMPQDLPGTMTPREGADVLAYMPKRGGTPSGATELPSSPEALNSIRFLARRL